MKQLERLTERIHAAVVAKRNRRTYRRLAMVMACIVVFATTYSLVLPAITLETDKAEALGLFIDEQTVRSASEAARNAGETGTGPVEEINRAETETAVKTAASGTETAEGTASSGTETAEEAVDPGTETAEETMESGTAGSTKEAGIETAEEAVDPGTEAAEETMESGTAGGTEEPGTETAEEAASGTDTAEEEAGPGTGNAEGEAGSGTEKAAEAAEYDPSADLSADPDLQAVYTQTVPVPGEEYSLTVSYGAEAGIPEGAAFLAAPVDDEAYSALAFDAVNAAYEEDIAEQLSLVSLFDLTIMHEGQVIEPAGPVDVRIDFGEAIGENQKIYAVHFPGTGQQPGQTLPSETSASEAEAQSAAETQQAADSIRMPSLKRSARPNSIAGTMEQQEQDDPAAAAAAPELMDAAIEGSSVSFTTGSFSYYAIVSYTVDFAYEVNGKTYDFSLPGGGFVSFTDLVEVLGIIGDTNTEKNGDETGSVITENAEENADNAGVEKNDVNYDTNTALTLGDVEVGEATRKFVADVASVEISSPSLVDVSKVENETTVGQIKEGRRLECQYSAELTEEQIAEINARTVEAGDWALISVQPFTSEETLTVTMNNGDVFTIRVTDAQIKKTVIDAKGATWEITVTYGPEAEIPEGAQLYVTEITEPEHYDDYMQRAAEAVERETGENSLLSGRFFDIQIKHGEGIVEPKAAVNVTIKYVEDVSLGKEDNMSAIHFTEDGIDLIEVNPEKKEDGGAEISFEQESFSVTGTIITSGVISNGNYCILYKNGNNYYALGNDGSATQVTVDENGTVKPVSGDDLPTNLIWTRNGQVWRGNQNTGRYLYPSDGSATANNSANLTISSSDDSNGNEVYKFSRSQGGWYPTTYYLRYSSGSFTGGTSNSNNQFYLARIESDTNVKIHYGYLDDSGNFVEWTDRLETLRNPNMLGDQYDVRVDIDGYEYVTTRLQSSAGTDIINLLQTDQDKLDGGNTPVSYDNNQTAVWKYRELTKDNAIYPSWRGIAYDYRSNHENYDDRENELKAQDIYVVYRPDVKSSSSSGSELEDIDEPGISKEKADNGDGTYDIDLSVTAQSTSSSKSGRANVVIVLDSSGSMNENAESGGKKWVLVTSSIKDLSTDLLGLNTGTGEDVDRVEFALVNFSNYVKNENWIYSVGANNKNQHFYTDDTAFNNVIDSLQVQGGTCWDKALAAANSILWDDNDPVYVVFISDGDTNSRAYANGNYDLWDGGTYVDNTESSVAWVGDSTLPNIK